MDRYFKRNFSLKCSCMRFNGGPDVSKMPKVERHLICDDSSINRLILKRILKKYLDIDADEASSGQKVIELVLENGEYEMIWMDIAIGDESRNGADICKILRKAHGYQGCIVALTGYTDEKTRKYCFANGMNNFIGKPYDIKIIQTVYKETLQKYGYKTREDS